MTRPAYCKKPQPTSRTKTNTCVYNPQVHGLYLGLQNQQEDKECGAVTGNEGTNRYFCPPHHRQLSGGVE